MDKDRVEHYAQYEQALNAVAIPSELLKSARLEGINRAKQELVQAKRQRWLRSVSVVMAILIVFFTSIRISPVFASTVAKLPGMSSLVELITWDKGIEDIIDQQYYEPLNITVTNNDLTLTLDGIIADESGMIVFYTLEAPYDISKLDTSKVDILRNGESIEGGYSFSWYNKEETNVIEDKIILDVPDHISYENASFALELGFKDDYDTIFSIPFTLQQPIAATKHYELNEDINIDGQQLTVQSLSISPLRASVKLLIDESNTMQLLQIQDIKLVDENGEEWGGIKNGTSGWGSIRDGEVGYNIQSNYFREPKQLTLHIGGIEALPKGQDYVEVDFEHNELLYIPKQLDINLQIINHQSLQSKIMTPKTTPRSSIFFGGIDAEGTLFYSHSSSSHYMDDSIETVDSYDMSEIVNPVRIYVNSYPSYLDGSVDISIPLE